MYQRKGQSRLAGGPIAVEKQSGEVREIRFDEIAGGIDHDLARFIANRLLETERVDGYLVQQRMEDPNRWLFRVHYHGDEVVLGAGMVAVDKVSAEIFWLTISEEPPSPATPHGSAPSTPFDIDNDTFWD